MMTMQEFVTKYGIAATVKRMPDHADGGAMMRHFQVTLHRGELGVNWKAIRVPFMQGMAWTTNPTPAEVLNCLALDASGADLSFEDWCSELGFDADSRKALATYNTVRKHAILLRAFLSADEYRELTTDVEAL